VADSWGPYGSERKRRVGNRWAGGLSGLKGAGGLRLGRSGRLQQKGLGPNWKG
jgi:hypothetical protein